MKDVTLERIPQKRIRAFIKNNISSLEDLRPSHCKGDPIDNFLTHEEQFYLNYPMDMVWEYYLKTNPSKIWNGNFVSFGLMLSRQDNRIMYADEPYVEAEVGQVYFMNLKIFKGLYQLAVSHEIIEINREKKSFDLSYIEGGKSIGFQRIALHNNGANKTKIIHSSFYKSKSKFRDRFIYPYFHTKVLKEYHSNMVKHISNEIGK